MEKEMKEEKNGEGKEYNRKGELILEEKYFKWKKMD